MRANLNGNVILNLEPYVHPKLDAMTEKILFQTSQGKIEIFTWNLLDAEIKSEIVSKAQFDVDFVSVTGRLVQVLNSQSVEDLMGNASAKFTQLCSTQLSRNKRFGRFLMYAKIGDWLLGYPFLIIGEPLLRNGSANEYEHESDDEEASLKRGNIQVRDNLYRFCVTILTIC